MAQFKPADHSKGDANTIGGYQAVHDRPAAFDGPDGYSYSVALVAEPTAERARPWGAFILFVRWARIGAQTPEGHLETDYLAYGDTERDALRTLGATPLSEVKRHLDALVLNGAAPTVRSDEPLPGVAGAAPTVRSNETPTSAAPTVRSDEPLPGAAGAAPKVRSNETPTSAAPKVRRWWDAMREPPPEDDA